MKAELEDGNYLELTESELKLPDETVQLDQVESASFTRPGRSDYHGALQLRCHGGHNVLAKVKEEDAGRLLEALRNAKERQAALMSKVEQRSQDQLDDDGAPPA